jgi:AbrB family looped-hinge helix DNA binding protein
MYEVSVARRETSTLSPEGRIVVPAVIRKQLGLEAGAVLTFRIEGDRVVMSTRDAAIAELQRLFTEAPLRPVGRLSDELIAGRRAETMRDDGA